MSAAWERMAEAMHVAPVDSEKMAARCEELASIVSTIASRGNLASADETRASIVAFLESLASAFEGAEADLTRTLAAQIDRGDDLRGDK
jgi:hypothetical protein